MREATTIEYIVLLMTWLQMKKGISNAFAAPFKAVALPEETCRGCARLSESVPGVMRQNGIGQQLKSNSGNSNLAQMSTLSRQLTT